MVPCENYLLKSRKKILKYKYVCVIKFYDQLENLHAQNLHFSHFDAQNSHWEIGKRMKFH